MPKVSVVVPVYNVDKYLERCLDSLVYQTLKDIEIVIVNDGSTDKSAEIIKKYVQSYPNKVFAFEKENGGLSDARNFGIKKCHGDYIGFVDSDDYVSLDMFKKLYEKAISKDFDITVCDVRLVWKNKSKEIVKVEHDDFVKIAKPALDEDFAIGNAYMQGRGLPKDYQKAFDAFYQGAKKGSSSCACKLGIFYEHGIYKGQNELLALYWYEESAYHNNVDGYYHLAKLYSSRSAMRFKRYIYYFLEKASRAHHKEALQLRSLLINQGAYVEGLFNISKVKADCFYHYAKHPSLRDIVYKNGVFKPQDISNAYKILGIAEPLHLSDPQIARDYIRRAYYHKMHEIHPDKKQFFESDKDSKEVVEVNKSYLLLSRLIN